MDVKGNTRLVTVGRIKTETHPLLSVDAVAPDGRAANLIVRDDWRPGDRVLGYLPLEDRHVGYPISEFCLAQ